MIAKMAWALAAAALLASCTDPVDEEQSASCTEGPRVAVLGQKYGKEGASSLDMVGCGKVQSFEPAKGMPAHSDVWIDQAGGNFYLIDRKAGTVTGFVGTDLAKPFLDQNVGSAGNPYGVAKLGDHLWVARFGSNRLLGIPFGDAQADSIDLSAYNDPKGTEPGMMAVKAWKGKLVTVLQRQKSDWTANDTGLVVLIDPATKAMQTISLPFSNPYDIDLRGDKLLVACAGSWSSSTDGGLALVNLAGLSVATSITGKTLGGDPSAVAMVSDSTAWVSIGETYPTARARSVDLSAGSVGPWFAKANQVGDLAFDGGSLWVANHSDDEPMVYRVNPVTGDPTGEYRVRLAPGVLQVLP